MRKISGDDVFMFSLLGVMSLLVLLLVFVLAVYMPASFRAESRCLASGYPNSAVDYKLNSYCMNLQGTVTVAVDKLP